jgi:dimethylhistidine N-methyltransferase
VWAYDRDWEKLAKTAEFCLSLCDFKLRVKAPHRWPWANDVPFALAGCPTVCTSLSWTTLAVRRRVHQPRRRLLPHSPQDSCQEVDQVFLTDTLEGLARQPKRLYCKYFYDERGSQLFDRICELPEYYLTRAEQAIMEAHVAEMAEQIGAGVMLVEFGSGSSTKTRILLDHLDAPVAYVPLDISEEHLLKTADQLQEAYPGFEILPLVADFTESFELPESSQSPSHAAVYFPGSTIGNFEPDDALCLFAAIAEVLGSQGGLLIGIDLQKNPTIIEAAYNDSQGTTDEFNLNALHRANRELGADFDVDQFHHKAVYNRALGRVEMYIVSDCDQTVTIAGQSFELAAEEHVLTEYSYKYTVEGFAALAAKAGFSLHKFWTDPAELFAVLHLVNDADN